MFAELFSINHFSRLDLTINSCAPMSKNGVGDNFGSPCKLIGFTKIISDPFIPIFLIELTFSFSHRGQSK